MQDNKVHPKMGKWMREKWRTIKNGKQKLKKKKKERKKKKRSDLFEVLVSFGYFYRLRWSDTFNAISGKNFLHVLTNNVLPAATKLRQLILKKKVRRQWISYVLNGNVLFPICLFSV